MPKNNPLVELSAWSLLKPLPEAWANILKPKVIAALAIGDDTEPNAAAAIALIQATCDEYSALPDQPRFTAANYDEAGKTGSASRNLGETLIELELHTARGEAELERAIEDLASYQAA